MAHTATTTKHDRLISLDQFRGYTVAGMLLVNFLASYRLVPDVLKHHHTYCSYADTIMVHFLFAVGFAYRLTFERRWQREGAQAAYARVMQRLIGLVLVAMVIHGASTAARTWDDLQAMGIWGALARPLKREWFQTLMQIAVTSIWITPVIRSRASVRLAFAAVSVLIHVGLSWWFNFTWAWSQPQSIDGGTWGFLTWTVAAISGTLACDMVTTQRAVRTRLLAMGCLLMALGWLASCGTRWYDHPLNPSEPPAATMSSVAPSSAGTERRNQTYRLADQPVFPSHAAGKLQWGWAEPPFVPPPKTRDYNYWMMSQRAGTASYVLFGAGFSFCVFCGFYVVCDQLGRSLPLFHTFGSNALASYVIHNLVDSAVTPFVPHDSPLWYVSLGFLVYFVGCYRMVRSLEKQGIFLRI